MLVYTKTQFDVFCGIFATYLFIHFAQLLPHAEELFSSAGMINDSSLLPTYKMVPSVLFYFDSPAFVPPFLVSLLLSTVPLGLDFYRRSFSLYLFYGWMCLLNRNPLISNPSLAYVGWLLLAISLTPASPSKGEVQQRQWRLPPEIYYGAWLIMALSYTASGVHKLFLSPSWLDGTALTHVLSSPLARENVLVWGFLHLLPEVVGKGMTWLSLFAEVSFLFLGCFYHLRKYYWVFFMLFHGGILMMVNFADLTFGVLMIHLFLFDWRFIKDFKSDFQKLKSCLFSRQQTPPTKTSKPTQKASPSPSSPSSSSSPSLLPSEALSFNSWLLQATLILSLSFFFLLSYQQQTLSQLFHNLTTALSLDLLIGASLIVGILALLMVLEQLFPHFPLQPVKGWWKWLIAIYSFQIFTVILGMLTWETWLQNTSYFNSSDSFHLRDHVNPILGGFIVYLFNSWVFYWWHLARHEIYPLWVLTHQMHHSASRLETITSFYKHPLEILLDSQIVGLVSYAILGVSPESSIWVSVFHAVGEYVYHMNLRTPQILGYFIQRPESHRLHHRKNARLNCPNYADLPIWDMLNNTFDNPHPDYYEEAGFPQHEEFRWSMLLFVDVLGKGGKGGGLFTKRNLKKGLIYFLVVWGATNSTAFLCHEDRFRGIGFASVSSPLPLVFSSYQGVETFATTFEVEAPTRNGTLIQQQIDSTLYGKIEGSYNRRNVYGVLFSHGPFFEGEKLVKLREEVLGYGVCSPGVLVEEFGFGSGLKVERFDVVVKSKTVGEGRVWKFGIEC